jgi:hypothetical protein
MISVDQFVELPPSQLRLKESEFYLQQLKKAGNADYQSTLFLMTAYFDAFVFAYISIEEMLPLEKKELLRATKIFRFFKALRNISTHHSVLTGIKGTKFERPIERHVTVGVGCQVHDAVKFFLVPEKLNAIFDAVLAERPKEVHTIEPARQFLEEISHSDDTIYVVDLMQSAISEASLHVA